ncbi:DUF397 domain-containing protein [Streptomyces sp. NPDC059070]|uniref:DUF397 domain-containing protein n=1 Tax=Streptomyces sp. NPDC059070 TaxID=3346713 RepID=UPI0036C7F7C3
MTDATNWQKSSFSGADNNQSCIELRRINGEINIRESENPGEIVTTDPRKLRAFILGVKAGEFDHLM